MHHMLTLSIALTCAGYIYCFQAAFENVITEDLLGFIGECTLLLDPSKYCSVAMLVLMLHSFLPSFPPYLFVCWFVSYTTDRLLVLDPEKRMLPVAALKSSK